jgi:succinyl-diaminopimelate desuccinylase
MLNDILPLAKQFIAIKSDPDNRVALEEILELALSQLSGFTIERFERDGTKSALIYAAKTRPKKFKILLNAHLDVIPAKADQYEARVTGKKMYGAGAMDMKSNAACLITVFKEVVNKIKYPLALQLVTDEEIGGFNGTKLQVERGVRSEFVIAGEPTNLNIVHRAKGVLLLRVMCKGKTAHGAYPWRGENAIEKMMTFIGRLQKKYPVPREKNWKTTVNLSRIETSNHSFNKIPDDCMAEFDIRYTPEEADTIVPSLKKLLPKGFRLEVVQKESSLFTEKDNRYLKSLQKTAERVMRKRVSLYGAQGTSDARHFSRVGCRGIEFGPIGGGIGTDREWVHIPSLETYCHILREFLLSQ